VSPVIGASASSLAAGAAVRTLFERHGWVLVCVIPALCALIVRGPIPLDETRYLSVAWEMWRTHDFALPALNGVAYTHKPPVMFWLMHVGWLLSGVNSWFPRLIPMLAALGAVFLTRRLAASLYSDRLQRIPDTAAWLLAGTLAWTAYVTIMLFDLLLVFWVIAAIVALERAERAPASSWCLYAVCIGAGLLTKGPAALVFMLPPALLAPWWSVGAGRAPLRWYGGVVTALVGGVALACLWVYAAFEQAGVDFLRSILWDQSANRMVNSFAHARPWWFYVFMFPVYLLPWLIWPTAWRALRAPGYPRADRLVISMVLPAFVFFSFVSGKQPHYLLPIVPMVVLWLAPRVTNPAVPLAGSLNVSICFFLLGFAGASTYLWHEPEPARIAVGFTTIACALLFLRSAPERYSTIRRIAIATATTMGLVTIAFYATIGESYRLDGAASVVRRLDAHDVPLAWIGPYAGQFNFLARLHRPIAELAWQRKDEMLSWIDAHPDGQLIAFSSGGRDIHIGPEIYRQRYRSGWLVIVPARDAEVAARTTGDDPDAEAAGD
jgi:4-amino-4-deoxy-L-arabinose transferase-like glycosyltransferase